MILHYHPASTTCRIVMLFAAEEGIDLEYRLVDIPISKCINSEINRIFLLTQFLTASLHRHDSERA